MHEVGLYLFHTSDKTHIVLKIIQIHAWFFVDLGIFVEVVGLFKKKQVEIVLADESLDQSFLLFCH